MVACTDGGRRLDLWRLRDFKIIGSTLPEDVLLYHCVAPNNPPTSGWSRRPRSRVRGGPRRGRQVMSLPHVERAIANCWRRSAGPGATARPAPGWT